MSELFITFGIAKFINKKDKNAFMPKKKEWVAIDKPRYKATYSFIDKIKKRRKKSNKKTSKTKEKLFSIIADLFEQDWDLIVEWLKDLFHVRKRMKKLTAYFALLFAGVTVALIGIARYLDCLCTTWGCGANYLLVGLAAVIIAVIYKRFI